MTYTNNMPNANQSLGTTQPLVRNNFNVIQTTIDQNHIDFNVAGAGKHFCLQMPNQGGLPAPTGGLIAGDGTLYTKSSTGSQIFYSPDNTTRQYQLTRCIEADFAKFATNTNYLGKISGGWTFLPGGMLLQYGTVAIKAPTVSDVVSFPTAFTNIPYMIQLTLQRTSATNDGVVVNSAAGHVPTQTTFEYKIAEPASGASTIFLNWLAIGV